MLAFPDVSAFFISLISAIGDRLVFYERIFEINFR